MPDLKWYESSCVRFKSSLEYLSKSTWTSSTSRCVCRWPSQGESSSFVGPKSPIRPAIVNSRTQDSQTIKNHNLIVC